MSRRKLSLLPTALLGEIVGYLDITSDVFFPQLQAKWEQTSRIEQVPFLEFVVSGIKQLVNGQLHSLHDEPTMTLTNGTKKWHWRGVLHRAHDKPAVECHNGDKEWYWRGKLHRGNGKPAIINCRGGNWWYRHGKPENSPFAKEMFRDLVPPTGNRKTQFDTLSLYGLI